MEGQCYDSCIVSNNHVYTAEMTKDTVVSIYIIILYNLTSIALGGTS